MFSKNSDNFEVHETLEDIRDMVTNYCEGIFWVFSYYRNGANQINLSWFYAYHYAPLFTDLGIVLSNSKLYAERGEIIPWEFDIIMKRESFLNVFEMMVSVFPPASINLVIEELRMLYSENSPILDLIPSHFLIDDDIGVMEEYQYEAILPIPNPLRITHAVASLGLKKELYDKYEPKPVYMHITIKRMEEALLGTVSRVQRTPTSQLQKISSTEFHGPIERILNSQEQEYYSDRNYRMMNL